MVLGCEQAVPAAAVPASDVHAMRAAVPAAAVPAALQCVLLLHSLNRCALLRSSRSRCYKATGYFLLHLILRNKTVNTATRHHRCACLLACCCQRDEWARTVSNQPTWEHIVCPTGTKIIGLVVSQYECGEKPMYQ